MQGLLQNRPLRVMRRRPDTTATFGHDFRNPVALVTGFNLVVTSDQLILELLGEDGQVAGAALLPRPEIEDRT